MNFLVFLLLVFCFNNARCDVTDICNFGTCGECISFALETCVWCSQDKVEGRRCQALSYANTTNTWCNETFIMYRPKAKKNVTENKGFHEKINDVQVQFRPQTIKIHTHPGITIDFDMSFKPAKHYPLDVYFLMDTSYTMKNNVKDLKTQTKKIYKDLLHYTNNVMMGVGAFVEKPGFPLVDFNVKQISESFKNLASLTRDMAVFSNALENVLHNLGANFDDPEAGFDALMQTMACEKELRWRKGARRIIVFCTDSPYHSAGDGKIVGAVKPNDMQCHLENNVYTKALTFDYPSVSQINKVATEGNFKIIFAAANNSMLGVVPKKEYKELTKLILGAKYVELNKNNDILKIIKEAYEESTRTVPLYSKPPDFVQLTIDQECTLIPRRNCENLHNQVTNIPATLKVEKCPTGGNLTQIFNIAPIGLKDMPLTIELEVNCECDCEKENPLKEKSPECHNAGYIQCGICKCLPGSYGANCQCSGKSTDDADMEKCKLKSSDAEPCSGRAKCSCGKCGECHTGFSGDFCEFDDSSCPSSTKKPCSGHGTCTRGQCQCVKPWTQKDCSCPDHNLYCIAPYSEKVCSGNGQCICGRCHCNNLEGKNESYTGIFCDNCKDCAERRCKDLKDYAYCNYMHMDNKLFCDQQNGTNNTKNINIVFVNNTEINAPQWYMAKWCKKDLENGTFVFKYLYEDHDLKLVIQKDLEKPPKANVWVAVGSAIGLVLLIGLLTVIIWKILVDKYDQREYNKFAKDAADAGYDVSVNVLYQEPRNIFANPVYNDSN